MKRWIPIVLLLLAACGTVSPAANNPTPSNVASAPSAETASDLDAIPQSVTAEGYHVLGRPDAPVTITFYSDFF